MERLKHLVPDELKRAIAGSTCETLSVTCAGLLEFLLPLPELQQVISELTDLEIALCRKNETRALDLKLQGNECFSKGNFTQAISFYSQALRYAPLHTESKDLNLVATLYVNQASSMHKSGLLEECLRDCNRAITVKPNYAKAWYRRGKVNESLQKHKDAIYDLEVALNTEMTTSGKKSINQELEILRMRVDSVSMVEPSEYDVEVKDAVARDVSTLCVEAPTKGRGMASPNDIQPATLIHAEDPLAAPQSSADCDKTLSWNPLSLLLQRSSGRLCILCNLSQDVLNHVADVISENGIRCKGVPEHKHECGGAHWTAVLPTDVVLAGRIVAKEMEGKRLSGVNYNLIDSLDLLHHYELVPPNERLELHIYAIVLCYCMNSYYKSDFQSTEVNISQLVLLLCLIKINSMAIVHVSSTDSLDKILSPSINVKTSCIEQVRVGQAIYSTGSLFNHSCQPNINSYFLSRTLFVRTTELVPSWTPLELSYGPQVGEMDIVERQRLLKEQYMFKCECSGCSSLNFSDLVINSFSCQNSRCHGVVLENITLKILEDNSVQALVGASLVSNLLLPASGSDKSIEEVAHKLFQKSKIGSCIHPGCCLNCNAYLDLDSVNANLSEATLNMTRLADSLDRALDCLAKIKSMRHQHSKTVAQAEDSIAEIFVNNGNLEHAIKHCKMSIQILEKLYHPSHIAIGHELIKLASLQLSVCHAASASDTIKRVEAIFSLYYGAHAAKLFPYVNMLRQQTLDYQTSCNLRIST
ncbi:Tetratricopeptide repeat (TPR)-like superfamily protein [Rhynchospora pubera]|uniref:Tetratricopeptide repeat (TPR)-like superfamily protein n=1 Tax=Rhynchospora pubera TaxID=906938 RepID=A0AAV8BRE6_9POAL|nr:Tetratricopeptide repeat (TPR)-like superfamily protein [Rhynchospora pubera]